MIYVVMSYWYSDSYCVAVFEKLEDAEELARTNKRYIVEEFELQ